jgi:serine protease Do
MKGQLIGIINAKSIGDGIEGIGFAIPSNDAKSIVEYLIVGPYLGITVNTAMDSFNNPYVYIHDLETGYNGNNLQKQDIILSLDGIDITSVSQIKDIMKAKKPGDTIDAVIKRGNDFIDVVLTVYQKPY